MKFIKAVIKKILYALHIDITRNQQYDRQTIQILNKVLNQTSNCIDIGCHKGEMLDIMLRFAPNGHHYAFEPIPSMYEQLQEKYKSMNVSIFPFALSDEKGDVEFHFVKNAPAYSGIKERKYAVKHPDIEIIKVQTCLLDEIIPDTEQIDCIKIDVEGAEFQVLKGSVNTIKRTKPYIIFEFGLGASDCYGTKPSDLYSLLHECGLKIMLLSAFLKNRAPLSKEEFTEHYNKNSHYYFIAVP